MERRYTVSWKLVLLLISISLGVQYMAIQSFQNFYPRAPLNSRNCLNCHKKDYSWKSSHTPAPSRRHILLFSQTRSGSSFSGQLFNQHPDIFYLFEPLYHVEQSICGVNECLKKSMNKAYQVANRDLLLNLYNCDLNFLENYILPEPKEHMTGSLFRQSSSRALCKPPVCHGDKKNRMEDKTNEIWCRKNCKTLNLTLASRVCQSRSHVCIKVVRIPKITELRPLAEDTQLDLRIIHLVRDPRAILASRMTTFKQFNNWKIWNATNKKPQNIDLGSVIKTCNDMKLSVDIGLNRPAWLHRRYLLVRYEDLALNPETKIREIYKFLNIDINNAVLSWISQNTNASSFNSSHYSTRKNSKIAQENWRHYLSFDIVKTVQTLCNNTLSLLGYKFANSEEQLRDIRTSFVEPRIFV